MFFLLIEVKNVVTFSTIGKQAAKKKKEILIVIS